MDKLSVQQKKAAKQAKSKKKPIKVVYISNPMKVKTSASEFRALVQELTGRDSDLTDTVARFSDTDSVQRVPDQPIKITNEGVAEVPRVDAYQESPAASSDSLLEPFDDVFTPQMLENFVGFLPPCLFTEFPQVDFFRSLDAM
ncbi:PREDICTED: sigma factor binding protein 1, chloroplastic-like [Nelumbo nucifera]|uniref:Sigma factor binding protein 1, chloroplastic-like n=1 Tax=Nelumbo nucifera TaxID=4432 RepID=A0A1U8BIY8_NELNU|nr:PREDICTED: sigma factor binding protein 1, chloroplastic-like [Nelumbo nucifera]